MTILPGLPDYEIARWWIGLIQKSNHRYGWKSRRYIDIMSPDSAIRTQILADSIQKCPHPKVLSLTGAPATLTCQNC